MNFVLEEAKNNEISYLDIAVWKLNNKIHIGIFKESAATNSVTPRDSPHPY